VLDCNLINNHIRFSFENYNHSKGGAEYSLLQIQSGHPCLVLADFPNVKEKHAFVYDAEEGFIIDNRKNGKKRLIEADDRSSVKKSRHCINSFFQSSKVIIRTVYCCTAK
jgi:hypothetical protein